MTTRRSGRLASPCCAIRAIVAAMVGAGRAEREGRAGQDHRLPPGWSIFAIAWLRKGIGNPKRKRHERRDVLPLRHGPRSRQSPTSCIRGSGRSRSSPSAAGCGPRSCSGSTGPTSTARTGVLRVNRRYTGGMLKEGGKTDGSVRAIPLRGKRARRARRDADTDRHADPDSSDRGGYIDIERFRHREWTPALRAAGLEHRRIYDCRHTFATWAIEDRVSSSGTSRRSWALGRQIEDTYARWLKRTDDALRAAFDAYDLASAIYAEWRDRLSCNPAAAAERTCRVVEWKSIGVDVPPYSSGCSRIPCQRQSRACVSRPFPTPAVLRIRTRWGFVTLNWPPRSTATRLFPTVVRMSSRRSSTFGQ